MYIVDQSKICSGCGKFPVRLERVGAALTIHAEGIEVGSCRFCYGALVLLDEKKK